MQAIKATINKKDLNPRANGQVERYVATVSNLLASEQKGENLKGWPNVLNKVQLAINCTVQKYTGFSPIHLLTGIDVGVSPVQYLIRSLPQLDDEIDLAKDRLPYERLRNNAIEQKKRFDRLRVNTRVYKVGDLVFVQQQNPR